MFSLLHFDEEGDEQIADVERAHPMSYTASGSNTYTWAHVDGLS